MLRAWLAVLPVGALLGGCATLEEPERVDEAAQDSEECRELAQRISGYRGIPARTGRLGNRQRNDQRWQQFRLEYDECMRARGHDTSG